MTMVGIFKNICRWFPISPIRNTIIKRISEVKSNNKWWKAKLLEKF